MKEKVKVLVLGAGGRLGQACVAYYSTLPDCQVFAWKSNVLDVTKQRECHEKITALAPDVILNCAAYTDVDGAQRNPALAMDVNAMGAKNVAVAAQSCGALLVYFSTNYVFDGTHQEGYHDRSHPNPLNTYGMTKLYGEMEVAKHCTKFIIVRTSNLYDGDSDKGKESFPEMVLRWVKEKKELNMINDEYVQPTSVNYLAVMTHELVRQNAKPGVYHITGPDTMTWYGWAQAVLITAGITYEMRACSRTEYRREAQRPQYAMLR